LAIRRLSSASKGVGEIEELGPGVTGFSVGERVCTCLPPLGAYSQERLYPANKLIKVPKDLALSDVQLAGLILKGMTAQYLLHRTHKVQPGDYVLIHAAAGGMGHILCPWARHLGATVIGTVSTTRRRTSLELSVATTSSIIPAKTS
jgi:NADPH:quinone reductase